MYCAAFRWAFNGAKAARAPVSHRTRPSHHIGDTRSIRSDIECLSYNLTSDSKIKKSSEFFYCARFEPRVFSVSDNAFRTVETSRDKRLFGRTWTCLQELHQCVVHGCLFNWCVSIFYQWEVCVIVKRKLRWVIERKQMPKIEGKRWHFYLSDCLLWQR